MNFGCLGIKDSFNAFYGFTHFRQLVFHSPELCLFEPRFSWATEHDLIGGDIRCNACLCADLGAIADMNVVFNADLASEYNVVSSACAPCDPDVSADQVMFTDGAVVRDLYEIVDFGSLADSGRSIGASVDGGISTDFYVVFDFDPAEL